MSAAAPVLEVSGLEKRYALRGTSATVRALDGISLTLAPGETLGLVGESGSGKSTAARCIVGLVEPSAGTIRVAGKEVTDASAADLREARRHMQMVFQDPYSSLDPRMSAGDIVAEPLVGYGIGSRAERRERTLDLFASVGLRREDMEKYPHQFSGGQRQRLGIARALALGPELVVCDEPVSALDVSVQAQVINLLIDLQEARGLSYLFVAHDLGVVEEISHRVAVLYLGRIVEEAPRAALFASPQHPYTEALLDAVPRLDPDGPVARRRLAGEIPSAVNPPSGCAFHTRCPYAEARCRAETPALREIAPGHRVACHLRG
ncbi:MAG TPA: oligopeptide/dipeptide ABC transporter ATP-binding protein [Hyphomicrobiales bacterium]|nr:oligopeptide/dipeptide ABC transporter ATP-binding protein [Hyphomicrobiales bacterium]